MEKKIKVYMGVPSTGNRIDQQCYALRDIEAKYGDRIELVYPKVQIQRIFHDYARNAIVEEFLATDCDVLWFLDSDIVPHRNTLDLIIEDFDKWMLAGCAYPIWMNNKDNDNMPQVYFTIYQETKDGGIGYTDTLREGKAFVGGLATGCMFVKRGVFEIMEKPYFEFKFDKDSRQMIEGEDLGFCLKVNKLGFQFFTDHELLARHYKTVDLVDVSNYAINRAKAHVQAFDDYVRPKVEALEQKLKAKISASKNQSKLILPSYDPR